MRRFCEIYIQKKKKKKEKLELSSDIDKDIGAASI